MGEGPAIGSCQRKEEPVLRRHRRRRRAGCRRRRGHRGGGRERGAEHRGSVAVPKTSPASTWTITPHAATPIKHLVVIFDENISFDHYFGTYPKATNTDGTKFTAAKHTPKVNGLTQRRSC